MSRVLPSAPPTPAAGSHRSAATWVRGAVRTARPKQWTKNVLVFAAPGAAGVLTHGGPLGRSVLSFVFFCIVASGTYFLNDSLDAPADRQHPTKRNRPIAAGVISVRAGMVTGVVLLAVGVALSALVTWRLSVVMAIYVVIQFAYSYYLKHQPIYDLAAVAAGFVLRAIAGGVAADVPVSEWFLLVATFGSLLMVTGKRVAEHADLGAGRGTHRATLDQYSATFLRTVLAISAGGAIIGYCIWALSLRTSAVHPGDPIWFQLSIVPMFIALLRYTFLVEAGQGAKPEDLVLSDRSLQILGVAWAELFAVGVYAS